MHFYSKTIVILTPQHFLCFVNLWYLTNVLLSELHKSYIRLFHLKVHFKLHNQGCIKQDDIIFLLKRTFQLLISYIYQILCIKSSIKQNNGIFYFIVLFIIIIWQFKVVSNVM